LHHSTFQAYRNKQYSDEDDNESLTLRPSTDSQVLLLVSFDNGVVEEDEHDKDGENKENGDIE